MFIIDESCYLVGRKGRAVTSILWHGKGYGVFTDISQLTRLYEQLISSQTMSYDPSIKQQEEGLSPRQAL